jgi:hypothetical protein
VVTLTMSLMAVLVAVAAFAFVPNSSPTSATDNSPAAIQAAARTPLIVSRASALCVGKAKCPIKHDSLHRQGESLLR